MLLLWPGSGTSYTRNCEGRRIRRSLLEGRLEVCGREGEGEGLKMSKNKSQ